MRETDKGLVIRGKIGMHTSPAYAEDVYIGALNGVDFQGLARSFAVAVNSPGVTVICRKRSARDPNPFGAPLSSRFDELDGQMWLDDVLIPWERVFLTEPIAGAGRALAVLAPALLLAGQGRVHPRTRLLPAPTRWAWSPTTRRSIT